MTPNRKQSLMARHKTSYQTNKKLVTRSVEKICKEYYLSTKNKKSNIIDTIHLLRNCVAHHRIGKYSPSEIVKILKDISILNSDIICDNNHKDYYNYVSNKQKVIIDKACLYQNKIDNIKKVEAVNAEA